MDFIKIRNFHSSKDITEKTKKQGLGGPVVKNPLSNVGHTQVRSLFRELRSHMWRGN